jgi:hypothetical protein
VRCAQVIKDKENGTVTTSVEPAYWVGKNLVLSGHLGCQTIAPDQFYYGRIEPRVRYGNIKCGTIVCVCSQWHHRLDMPIVSPRDWPSPYM